MSGFSDSVEALGPSLYYRMNDLSGTNCDAEVGTLDGTYSGSPTLQQTGLVDSDLASKSVYFDGTNDYVDLNVALTELKSHTLGSVTIVGSFPVGGSLSFNTTRSNDLSSICVFSISEGYAQFYPKVGGLGLTNYVVRTTGGYTANTRYHVTFVWDATYGILIYVNGVKQTTSTIEGNATGGMWFNDVPLADRCSLQALRRSSVGYYEGTISELYVYDFLLTEQQNLDLYNTLVSAVNITGTITESLSVTSWFVRAYLLSTGEFVKEEISTDGTFDLEFGVAQEVPLTITVTPDHGDMWVKDTAYSVDDLVFSTDPDGDPYYYKCTTAGTSDSTEPTWPTSGTVTDNTAVWTYMGTLVQPITQSPRIPV